MIKFRISVVAWIKLGDFSNIVINKAGFLDIKLCFEWFCFVEKLIFKRLLYLIHKASKIAGLPLMRPKITDLQIEHLI